MSEAFRKKTIIIFNLNRHQDLLNLSEYIYSQLEPHSKSIQARVVVSQNNYDGLIVNYTMVKTITQLIQLIFSYQPTLIYITGPSKLSFFALCIQKIIFNRDAVTHLHRFDYKSYMISAGLALRVYNYLVTCLSKFCIVHSEKIAARHDNYLYAPLPFHAKRDNRPGTFIKSGLNILFFGRIDRNKGLIRVLELAKLLPSAKFFVFGEIVDSKQRHIVDKIRQLPNCIVKADRVLDADIPEMFNGKDVVIMPYFDGTQSGVPNLSASYGVPVLSTPFGDILATIKEHKCGLCQEYTPDGWVRVLRSTNWKSLSTQISIDTVSIDSKYQEILEVLVDNR